eukprot:jgi/Hompol1/1838/HPOL_004827-RA
MAAEGRAPQQFHGKWPFVRVLGLQEPAAVVFSLLNGAAHARGLARFTATARTRSAPLFAFVRAAGFIAVNSWLWSVVYHARDKPWSERLDYFSAMASILFSLYLAVIRCGNLSPRSRRDRPLILYLSIAALSFFLCHVAYLSFWKFDYSYNMRANVSVGVIGNLIWLSWAIINFRSMPHAWKMVVLVVSISLAMSLELFDFPPIWGVFDAHALWHAATVPIVPLYWSFFLDDALFTSTAAIDSFDAATLNTVTSKQQV